MIRPVELLVDLDRHADGSLRRRLEREIREGIRSGRLAPGAALPSTRALAAQIGVSRGLVVEAYAQLVAEGYLTARQGAKTLVAARSGAGGSVATAPPPAAPTRPPDPTVAGSRHDFRAGVADARYDFRAGHPDLSAFPRGAWLAAAARTLRALPDARLGYGDARGAIELREALAAYLGRVRGVVADPARLQIGGGTRQGLDLVWRVLDGEVDWFELRNGVYVLREPDAHGILASVHFVGLRLHAPSLLAGDTAGILAAFGLGRAS